MTRTDRKTSGPTTTPDGTIRGMYRIAGKSAAKRPRIQAPTDWSTQGPTPLIRSTLTRIVTADGESRRLSG